MEIFKEDFEKSNLMFTDDFKVSSMSIVEFLSNPNYYKIMLRSNTRVCLRIRKNGDAYIAMACVLDTRTGGWISLDYKVNDNLYKAIMDLNGLKDESKIDKKIIEKLQKYYEDGDIKDIDIFNSEKENKISARMRLNDESASKENINTLVNELISKLTVKDKKR